MKLLELRKQMKKRKPDFSRQDSHKKKRVGTNWRKPRGIASKMRLQLKGKKPIVKAGYCSPKEVRGLNRDGLKEVIVANVKDLNNVKEKMIALISSQVGAKKIIEIIKEAKKLNVQISNYNDEFVKKHEEIIKQKKEIKKKREAKKEEKKKSVKKEEEKSKEKETKEEKKTSETQTKVEVKTEEKKEKEKLLTKKGAL